MACITRPEYVDTALALARNKRWVIHVLLAEKKQVEDVRQKAAKTGLLGRTLYVEQGGPDCLPHADNLLDLVIASDATPEAEVLRVLAPVRGRAIVGGRLLTKPALPGSNDWTHRLHGPDNNPVSSDTAFSMPAMLQYLAMPMQTSYQGAMLVAGGRRIELSDWVVKNSDRKAVAGKLLARSLYNGQILWERELPRDLEPDQPICALDADRVYLAAGDAGRVLAISAETGEDLPAITLSEDTHLSVKWLGIDRGRLHVLLGEQLPVRKAYTWILAGSNADIRQKQAAAGRTLVAWDLRGNRQLWRHEEPAAIDYRTIALREGKTFFYSEKTRLACLDEHGEPLWENRDPAWIANLTRKPIRNPNTEAVSTLIVGPAGQLQLSLPEIGSGLVFNAADGKLLWKNKAAGPKNFFVGDRFYCPAGALDGSTGELLERTHFLGGWCGISTWVPALKTGLGHVAFGMRSPCGVGIYAAGGVVVVMPSQCDCWPVLRGAGGLAPAGGVLRQVKQSPQHPLETGSAPDGVLRAAAGDWPQYRGDVRHSGAAAISAGLAPRVRWIAKLDRPFPVPEGCDMHRMEWLERPTPPVTAGEMAFYGASDGAVRAVRMGDGKRAWSSWTGGAVLTAPTVADGRVYFGSCDGWLYCLDAASGELVWRWRGAPAERRMMVYGKMMSSWPLTAALVHEGTVYGVAGQWMQNGVVTFALDAATGRPRWRHWTKPDNNHFLDLYLGRDDPAFAPAGQLAMVGKNLWARDYLGVPVIFDTESGRRLPMTTDMVAFQKTYWNFGTWFATAGRDILVVDDHLVLQGGFPLLGNPDIRHDNSGAKFVALRINENGQVPGLPHPPNAIPNSQIAPALAGSELLVVGGVARSAYHEATIGLSLWTLEAWKGQFDALVNGRHGDGPDSGSPEAPRREKLSQNELFKKQTSGNTSLDMALARWRRAEADINAVALCPDAAVVVAGETRPAEGIKYGEHPGFAGWKLAAFDRATGKQRWSVALPGEPVFNGLAPAADGSWVLTLRDGSLAIVTAKE
ncbi:MAG: PQQ-binding-like beta-propeller repeat protein [Thermoguttaceae bacterium]